MEGKNNSPGHIVKSLEQAALDSEKQIKACLDLIALDAITVSTPIKRFNAIVIEPDETVVKVYKNIVAHCKNYADMDSFYKDCESGKVMDNLIENTPLLIITEVQLPQTFDKGRDNENMDYDGGIKLAKKIRAGEFNSISKNIPLLFCSYRRNDAVKNQINSIEGITAYINKPFASKMFQEVLYSAAKNNYTHDSAKLDRLLDNVKNKWEKALSQTHNIID